MVTFEIRPLPDGSGFALEGELDMASADRLLASTADAFEKEDLVLDMSRLTFMDSSGLRAILQLAHRRNGTSRVSLVGPTPAVRRVLDIALPGGTPGVQVTDGGGADG